MLLLILNLILSATPSFSITNGVAELVNILWTWVSNPEPNLTLSTNGVALLEVKVKLSPPAVPPIKPWPPLLPPSTANWVCPASPNVRLLSRVWSAVCNTVAVGAVAVIKSILNWVAINATPWGSVELSLHSTSTVKGGVG